MEQIGYEINWKDGTTTKMVEGKVVTVKTKDMEQIGNVWIEATVKVRVNRRVTLWNEDSEEYLLEAMYDGDIEIIEVADTPHYPHSKELPCGSLLLLLWLLSTHLQSVPYHLIFVQYINYLINYKPCGIFLTIALSYKTQHIAFSVWSIKHKVIATITVHYGIPVPSIG